MQFRPFFFLFSGPSFIPTINTIVLTALYPDLASSRSSLSHFYIATPMPIPQAPQPSFSIVVNSGPVSAVLNDYQRARNRNIQLPIYGPFNSPTVRYRDVTLGPTS